MASNSLRGSLINLSNSIIGVSLLTMPYCFQQCGIVLACAALAFSALLNKYTSHLLLKAAIVTRRRKLEYLAYQTLGYKGKLLMEFALILFLLGGGIALFVVTGDLLPALTGSVMADESRLYLLGFLAFFVALPLSLRRSTSSLTSYSIISMLCYVFLALKMLVDSLPFLLSGSWIHRVTWWNTDNLLLVLPIFTMALAGQPQLFEVFEMSLVDVQQMRVLDNTVSSAIRTCLAVYAVVGFCGYVAQHNRPLPLPGNALLLLPDNSWLSWAFQLGFVASIIMSIPLCLFPCRTSLHSLIYRRGAKLHEATSLADFIPENRFKMLTASLLFSALAGALLIPRIELFLGISGATIGCFVCLVTPAAIFLGATNKDCTAVNGRVYLLDRFLSHGVIILGIILMALCSFSMVSQLGDAKTSAFVKQEIKEGGSSVGFAAKSSLVGRPSGDTEKLLKGLIVPRTQDNYKVKYSFVEGGKKDEQGLKSAQQPLSVSVVAPLTSKNKAFKTKGSVDPQKTANELPAFAKHIDAHTIHSKRKSASTLEKEERFNDPQADTLFSQNKFIHQDSTDLKLANSLVNPSVGRQKSNSLVKGYQKASNNLPIDSTNSMYDRKNAHAVVSESLPFTVREVASHDAKVQVRASDSSTNKVEIKLLEKIAEVQNEQKKMIENIHKELQEEIALHKEMKANQSRATDRVEQFQEKMEQIDRHMKEVDQMSNRTLKEVIETGLFIPTRKRTAKSQKSPLGEGVSTNNGNLTDSESNSSARVKSNVDLSNQLNARQLADSFKSRQAYPLERQISGLSNDSTIIGALIPSDNNPANNDRIKPPVVSVSKPTKKFDHVTKRTLHAALTSDGLAKPKSFGIAVLESIGRPGSSMVSVEKAALLSEVSGDKGPALMKDVDRSLKQDKAFSQNNLKIPNVESVVRGVKDAVRPIEKSDIKSEEPKVYQITAQNSKKDPSHFGASAEKLQNKTKQTDNAAQPPLAVKMSPLVLATQTNHSATQHLNGALNEKSLSESNLGGSSSKNSSRGKIVHKEI